MQKCKLGDIADFKNGVNYNKDENGYSYKCIGVTDFSDEYLLSDFNLTNKVNLNSAVNDDYLLNDYDILLVRSNGNKQLIGRSMMVFPHNEEIIYSGFCIRCRITSSKAYPPYILFLLKDALNKGMFAKNQQTNINNINQSILSNLEIFLPDYNTQKSIANYLLKLIRKIELNRETISILESLSKTLYDYYFLQFDFPDEKDRPYKSSGGKMEYNAELGREIPAGWKVEYLAEHITSSRGISYSTKTLGDNGIPMINLASFGPYGSYKESGLKYYIGNYTKEDIIKPYDLIMCNTQQTAIKFETDIIGHAFLVPDIFNSDIVSSHHMTKISVDNEALKYYLVKLFNTAYFHKYISGHTNGTNILGLLFSGVSDYKEAMPPQAVLDYYANKVKPIEQEKSRVIKENRHLTALRDFLLPLLMNGQVGFKK